MKSTHLGLWLISKKFFKLAFKFMELFELKSDSPLHDAVGVNSLRCMMQEGVKSCRCIMQQGDVTLCCSLQQVFRSYRCKMQWWAVLVVSQLLLLHHTAESKILSLQITTGSRILLLRDAAGSRIIPPHDAVGSQFGNRESILKTLEDSLGP
jgi:hypothetical protein